MTTGGDFLRAKMELETTKKGEALKLPTWVTLQAFVDANIVGVSTTTLRSWCRDGYYPKGKKAGKYWYIDWRNFLLWFDDMGKDPYR